MSELERALAAPASAGDGGATAERRQLERLQAAFERHVANAESDGGLFQDVIDHAPRLVRRVDKVHHDHDTVTIELAALASGSTPRWTPTPSPLYGRGP